jgi:8-oxo-dGTP pyrophosphatase MutT (NUDIX family)
MRRERSAGAIIFREEKRKIYYLLLHYESGHWDFPKGHIEKEEEEKETVKREVREETGLRDIKFIQGFKEKIQYFFRKTYPQKAQRRLRKSEKGKPPLIFKEVVFYLAETKKNNIEISFEHLGYQWLSYKEAIEKVTFRNAKEILKRANDFLRKRKYV